MPTPASAWPCTSDAAIVAMPISAKQREGGGRADEAVNAVRGIDRAEQRESAGGGQDAGDIGVGDALDRHLEAGPADELAGGDQRDAQNGSEDQPHTRGRKCRPRSNSGQGRCRRAPAPGRRPKPPSACRARSRWSGAAGVAAGGAAGPSLALRRPWAGSCRQARRRGGSGGERSRQLRRQPQRWRRLPSARPEPRRPRQQAQRPVSAAACAPAPVTVTFSRCARKAVRKPSRSNSRTRRRCCWRQTTIASATIATIAIRGVGSSKNIACPRSTAFVPAHRAQFKAQRRFSEGDPPVT